MFKDNFLNHLTNIKTDGINKKIFQIYEKKIKRFQTN